MNSSEIIINNDGSIYHLCLKPFQVSKNIILVGDPNRVDIICKYLNLRYILNIYFRRVLLIE